MLAGSPQPPRNAHSVTPALSAVGAPPIVCSPPRRAWRAARSPAMRAVALLPLLERINTYLKRWAGRKHKRLRTYKRVKAWWLAILDRAPELFAHWRWARTFA